MLIFLGSKSGWDWQGAGGGECRLRGPAGREAHPPPPGGAGAVQVLSHSRWILRFLAVCFAEVGTRSYQYLSTLFAQILPVSTKFITITNKGRYGPVYL